MESKNALEIVKTYFLIKGLFGTIGILLYLTGNYFILTSSKLGTHIAFLFGDLGLFKITILIPVIITCLGFITYSLLKKEMGIGRILAIILLTTNIFSFPLGTIISLIFIIYLLSPYAVLKPIGKTNKPYRIAGAGLLVFAMITTLLVTGIATDIVETVTPTAPLTPQAKIQSLDLEGQVDVIIEMQPVFGTQAVQIQSVVIQNIQTLGGTITDSTYTLSNSLRTTIDADNLTALASDPRITAIYPNIPVWYAPQATQHTRYTGLLDNSFSIINAESLWKEGLTGKGVVVAVVDTGINSQLPIFQRNGKKIVIDTFTVTGIEYVMWHGTSVSSCIVSNDPTLKGIAPDAELLNVNVFQLDGSANIWDIKKGWDWVARWKTAHPDKKVICCNSLGAHPYAVGCGGWSDPSPLDVDANNMVLNQDIPMIVAAGNRVSFGPYLQFPLKINSPGQAEHVLTVGAIDDNLNIASFSCRGGTEDDNPKPDCVAPGVEINLFHSDGSIIDVSGTSFSTPITAGVVALIAEEHQEHSATQIQDAIKDSADDLGPQGYDTTYGYGLVNGGDALAVINGQIPEKTYTAVGIANLDIPLGTLPLIAIIGIGVLFYPEYRRRYA